jgi:hypothetical protein
MLTIVRDAVDDRAYSFAREARILRKDGAYHETFEFHDHVILQVRAVLHRRVFVNSRVTPVWSTAEAVFGVVFVEGEHSLIFPPRFPCAKHQVTMKALVEKFLLRNLDCFDLRHVAIHRLHQKHYS